MTIFWLVYLLLALSLFAAGLVGRGGLADYIYKVTYAFLVTSGVLLFIITGHIFFIATFCGGVLLYITD